MNQTERIKEAALKAEKIYGDNTIIEDILEQFPKDTIIYPSTHAIWLVMMEMNAEDEYIL